MAFEYIANGRQVQLPVSKDKVAVRFREPADEAVRRATIDPKPEVGAFDDRYEVPDEKFTIVNVAPPANAGPSPLAAAVRALDSDEMVERVAPVFDLGTAQAVATDRVLVGFKPDTRQTAQEVLGQHGRVEQFADNEYLIHLNPAADPFDVIAEVRKRAEVEYAEPDFVTIGQHVARNVLPLEGSGAGPALPHPALLAPDESELEEGMAGFQPAAGAQDPLLGFQYAMRITRATDAWNLISPSPAVSVAILDEGVDVGHPDLSAAIRGTFDAFSGTQPNPWDSHGTACAGLAAAIPNNGLGVRGSGGGCSLLAARIARSPQPGADWVSTNSGIQRAIDWAWQNGADILSNSWGGGAPSGAIINAFERARTLGRNGKGCVIVVAAGNHSRPVDFPGNLPNVLTVSASNEFDEPKTRTSADGENWGSNFGSDVDVAAPGVHNYTTDNRGAAGYNAGGGSLNGDYVSNFNGTSSSTPIVAGIAALVLSANPNLREAQVRRILKQNADKVGSVLYVNGRNDQMGHGRVNASRAVQAALAGL